MRVTFARPDLKRSGAFVVFITDGGKLSASANQLDKATKGSLKRALESSKFKGSEGQALAVLGPAGVNANQILLLGIGTPDRLITSLFSRSVEPFFIHLPLQVPK